MGSVTNIFTSGLENNAMPQPTFLFKVIFDGALNGDTAAELVTINNGDQAVSMTATMPKATVKTVTQWYKGTPKTRIVNQDRSGDTSLKFVVTRNGLGALKTLFNVEGINLDDTADFTHEEFYRAFTKLHIYTLMSSQYPNADIIADKNISAHYILYNCIVTDFNFTDLAYSDSGIVEFTATVHYDYWSCE